MSEALKSEVEGSLYNWEKENLARIQREEEYHAARMVEVKASIAQIESKKMNDEMAREYYSNVRDEWKRSALAQAEQLRGREYVEAEKNIAEAIRELTSALKAR